MEKTQNGEGTLFGNVTDLGKQFLNMDGAKKFAAWYIDNSEKMSNGVLDYQASATDGQGTRLGPIFEAQFDFSRKFVKRSAEVARRSGKSIAVSTSERLALLRLRNSRRRR